MSLLSASMSRAEIMAIERVSHIEVQVERLSSLIGRNEANDLLASFYKEAIQQHRSNTEYVIEKLKEAVKKYASLSEKLP